jgi:two-component sensor histidine kinase
LRAIDGVVMVIFAISRYTPSSQYLTVSHKETPFGVLGNQIPPHTQDKEVKMMMSEVQVSKAQIHTKAMGHIGSLVFAGEWNGHALIFFEDGKSRKSAAILKDSRVVGYLYPDKGKTPTSEGSSIDEFKSNLIANVNHELRTPLTIAQCALELAREEEREGRREELLKMAMNALVRQNVTISNLLDASYMGDGSKREVKLEEVNLTHVITLVSSEFKPTVIQRKIEVDVRVQKNLLGVRADYEQLTHVVRNLFSNAIKFNKDGGEVIIEAEKKGGMVEVCVSDTGIGIPSAMQEKIFERFYQLDSSITRPYVGTGMGLAVAKEIVEEYGGKIWTESEPGRGSKFYFTWPIAKGGAV